MQSDEDDAGRNHRFHNPIGKPEDIERGKGERQRVRDCEGRHHFHKVPHAGDGKDEGRNEKQMIVSAEDVLDSMSHERDGHRPLIHMKRRWRDAVPIAGKRKGHSRCKQQAFAEETVLLKYADNVTGFPPIAWREDEFVKHILTQRNRVGIISILGNVESQIVTNAISGRRFAW